MPQCDTDVRLGTVLCHRGNTAPMLASMPRQAQCSQRLAASRGSQSCTAASACPALQNSRTSRATHCGDALPHELVQYAPLVQPEGARQVRHLHGCQRSYLTATAAVQTPCCWLQPVHCCSRFLPAQAVPAGRPIQWRMRQGPPRNPGTGGVCRGEAHPGAQQGRCAEVGPPGRQLPAQVPAGHAALLCVPADPLVGPCWWAAHGPACSQSAATTSQAWLRLQRELQRRALCP